MSACAASAGADIHQGSLEPWAASSEGLVRLCRILGRLESLLPGTIASAARSSLRPARPGTAQAPIEPLPQPRPVPGRPGPPCPAFSAPLSSQPPPLHTSFPVTSVLTPPQPRRRSRPRGRSGLVGEPGRGRCRPGPCEPGPLPVPGRAHGADIALSWTRCDRSVPTGKGFRGAAGTAQRFHSTCVGPGAAFPFPRARASCGTSSGEAASERLHSPRRAERTPREALLLPHPSGVPQSPAREGLRAVPCPHGRRQKELKTFRGCCGPVGPRLSCTGTDRVPCQTGIIHRMDTREGNQAGRPDISGKPFRHGVTVFAEIRTSLRCCVCVFINNPPWFPVWLCHPFGARGKMLCYKI